MVPGGRKKANVVLAWINFLFMTISLIVFLLLVFSGLMVSGQWQAKLWAILIIAAVALPFVLLFFFNWNFLRRSDRNGNGTDKIEQSL